MAESKTDLQLISEFNQGNQESFEELIQRYSDKAFHLAIRLTRNQQDAEEVLQDVFVTVARKIKGFEGKSSFSSWLYRVTLNAALMKLRKRKSDRSVSIEDILPQVVAQISLHSSDHLEADKIAARHQLVAALESAIRKLPEEYRPVFVLRDIDGLTSRQVSKMLNLSVPAVKSRLHRSRLMLRRGLMKLFREFYDSSTKNSPSEAGNF